MEEKDLPSAQTAEQTAPEAVKHNKSVKEVLANYFTATRIAYMAIFTALSYVLRFLEFVILPGTPVAFLKFDFSNMFPLIGGFALGPVAGMTIGVLKEVLWMFFSTTAGVGEIANIIIMLPFVLIPTIAYKYHKGIKSVLIFVAIGCICQVLWSFPVNWLLNFPVFLSFNWKLGMAVFMQSWYWVMLFNLIKSVIIAVVVLLLYKSISRLIKLTNDKFTKKKN